MSNQKRTVEDVEGGRRRGREDYEQEGEQSEAGGGIQRADAATLAQRRLLRLNPEARSAAQQQQQRQGGAFAGISTTNNSTSAAPTPFVWGSGFYNPPQPQPAAPSASLVAGGKIDNKPENDAAFADDDDDTKKDTKPSWTTNPFAVKPAAGAFNPFASTTSGNATTTTTSTTTNQNPFSGSANFTFAFAAPPSSFGNNKSDSSATSDSTSGGAAAFAAAPTVAAVPSEGTEDTLYSTDACKLYLFTKDEEGKSSWKERGAGLFKIIVPKAQQEGSEGGESANTKARLIMRNTQTKKGILNCPIDDSLKLGKIEESQIMFTSAAADDVFGGPPPKDTVQSFLLRANKMASKEILATIVQNIQQQQAKVASA